MVGLKITLVPDNVQAFYGIKDILLRKEHDGCDILIISIY